MDYHVLLDAGIGHIFHLFRRSPSFPCTRNVCDVRLERAIVYMAPANRFPSVGTAVGERFGNCTWWAVELAIGFAISARTGSPCRVPAQEVSKGWMSVFDASIESDVVQRQQ